MGENGKPGLLASSSDLASLTGKRAGGKQHRPFGAGTGVGSPGPSKRPGVRLPLLGAGRARVAQRWGVLPFGPPPPCDLWAPLLAGRPEGRKRRETAMPNDKTELIPLLLENPRLAGQKQAVSHSLQVRLGSQRCLRTHSCEMMVGQGGTKAKPASSSSKWKSKSTRPVRTLPHSLSLSSLPLKGLQVAPEPGSGFKRQDTPVSLCRPLSERGTRPWPRESP